MPVNWVDGITPVNAANLEIMEADIAAALAVPERLEAITRAIPSGDANDAVQNGWYFIAPGNLNRPPVETYYALQVYNVTGTAHVRQIAYDYLSDTVWMRRRTSNTWGAWAQTGLPTRLAAEIHNHIADADLAKENGWYSLIPGGGNSPDPAAYFLLYAQNIYGNQVRQIAYAIGNYRVYTRRFSSAWHPWMQVGGDKIEFSPGAAADTNLYRAAADTLKTDDDFHSAGLLTTQNIRVYSNTAQLVFGTAYDTNLYRLAADTLKTDDTLEVVGNLILRNQGGALRLWFGDAADTSLYRSDVGTLKTPGSLEVDLDLILRSDSPTRKLYFGSAADTNLYRAAPNMLKTDDAFVVAGDFYLNHDSVKLYFGATNDTNLYRSAANVLKTDDQFHSAQYFVANAGDAANEIGVGWTGKIYFGSAADTNLYRSAANTLKTDDTLDIDRPLAADFALRIRAANEMNARLRITAGGVIDFGSGGGSPPDVSLYRHDVNYLRTNGSFVAEDEVYVDFAGTGKKLFFGTAADTNLYRSAANELRTDDALVIGSSPIKILGTSGGGIPIPGTAAGSYESINVTIAGAAYKIPVWIP